MTKNGWVKALFRELNTTETSASEQQDRHRERWQRQRQTSEPPEFKPSASASSQTLADDYDAQLSLLARQSLQLDKRPDARRQQSDGWPDWHSRQRQRSYDGGMQSRLSFPQAPAYTPDRLASTPPRPGGPRPLYAQEVPTYDPVKQWNGQSTLETVGHRQSGGFVQPGSSPVRHKKQQQAYEPSPAQVLHRHSYTPARPYTHSSPTRPTPGLLQTPPPLLQRPHSDPYQARPSANFPSTSQLTLHKAPGEPSKPNQCHGTTASGKRCTRTVGAAKGKTGNGTPQKARDDVSRVDLTVQALMQLDRRLSISRGRKQSPSKGKHRATQDLPDDGDDEFDTPTGRMAAVAEDDSEGLEELPVYCFQHAKQTLDQKGIFVNSKYIDFEDWIPPGLPQDTKLQLRHEMSKPFSPDDPPGYIYVHEMASKDHQTMPTTFIKLGRSIKPVARLSQWKSQCRSRQPIVRDIFPLHASHPLKPGQTVSGLLNHSPSRLHGNLAFADRGAPNHHRWERLCLIELAGLAALQNHARQKTATARQKCPDCGKVHVELFLVDKGTYEQHVVDIVLRWQRFVET